MKIILKIKMFNFNFINQINFHSKQYHLKYTTLPYWAIGWIKAKTQKLNSIIYYYLFNTTEHKVHNKLLYWNYFPIYCFMWKIINFLKKFKKYSLTFQNNIRSRNKNFEIKLNFYFNWIHTYSGNYNVTVISINMKRKQNSKFIIINQ